MRDRIRFILIYFAFWTIYFIVARVIFLSYHINDTKSLTIETVFNIFWYGVKMDFSMAAYLSIFPFLWVSFSNFIKKSIFQTTLFTYTFVAVFIMTLIVVADLEIYNVWDFRIDATPLNYLSSPKEAWASVKSSPIIQLILSFFALIIVANFIVYRILADKIDHWKKIKNLPWLFYGLIFTAALIIPIRGGFGIAPMNHSSVYFSKNNFANIAAINAPWNFLSSVINRTTNKVNPYTYVPKDVVENTLISQYPANSSNMAVLNTTKPNVLLIIWESFTKKVIDKSEGNVVITPYFNKLKNEGIYFSDFYASGDRTDKALTSVLSAYPAQPTTSIVKEPVKSATLPVISKDFNNNGFNTEFYYGGDTEFANIKSYLFGGNFNRMVDKDQFPEELNTSKWGVHDQYVFDKFLVDHQENNSKPFFSTLLTLSSHEPFETPRSNVIIKGESNEKQFLNSLNYTDECLGKFIEKAKKQTWWKNTLIIIVADHGHPMPEVANNKVERFKIPMLWTGGAINKSFIYPKIGSQVDIAATLLAQLNIDNKKYNWSKNLFGNNTKPWAFYAFNDGFGYIKPGKQMVFDNIGKVEISKFGKLNSADWIEGKVMQQATFQDYLNR